MAGKGAKLRHPGSEKVKDVSTLGGGFRVGEILGGTYRVRRRLAVCGMGEVYLCSHTRLTGSYVAKVLNKDLEPNDENNARFRREAEILAALKHPNVVQVFDFNVTPAGLPYLIMEYVDGQDLGAFLESNKFVSAPITAHIVKQVASALQAAHDVGIVHRDLKPENVLLTSSPGQQYFVKVIDFGISIKAGASRVTSQDVLMGTPQFMSPEQALGLRELDGRSDEFSLASLAYLMLVGELPFPAETPVSALYHVVHTPMRVFPISIVPEVAAVIQRALSKNPAERYGSIIAFSTALEQAVRVTPLVIGEERPHPPIVEAAPTMRVSHPSRGWKIAIFVLLALSIVAIISAVLLARNEVWWNQTIGRISQWMSIHAYRLSARPR